MRGFFAWFTDLFLSDHTDLLEQRIVRLEEQVKRLEGRLAGQIEVSGVRFNPASTAGDLPHHNPPVLPIRPVVDASYLTSLLAASQQSGKTQARTPPEAPPAAFGYGELVVGGGSIDWHPDTPPIILPTPDEHGDLPAQ